MTKDYLLEWWMQERFDRFCKYMQAWNNDHQTREDHRKKDDRIDRAISYIDMDDQHKGGGGFIKQYLLMKYAMEFVEYITEAYWQIEQTGYKESSRAQ